MRTKALSCLVTLLLALGMAKPRMGTVDAILMSMPSTTPRMDNNN